MRANMRKEVTEHDLCLLGEWRYELTPCVRAHTSGSQSGCGRKTVGGTSESFRCSVCNFMQGYLKMESAWIIRE
jgi:hypothetical protein